MKFPKASITQARQLYRASLVDGILDPAKVRSIAQKLVTDKPRHYIPTLRYLHKLVRLELQSRHVSVESATELDGQQKQNLLNTLAGTYGTNLTTEFSVNPELIGGAKVRVGSDVYDGSVRGRLARLKSTFGK